MANNRIMIVEDEAITAAYTKRRLEKFGYIVTSTPSSSEEAIENAEKERPDVILMDIKIKGAKDGVETAYEIMDRFNIPSIYLTAHSDVKTLEHAKITEPYAYITKPFEPELLNFSIQMALYKHETQMKLKELVHYDFLTKLPNRALFFDRLEQALRHAKRNGTIAALLMIDIDEFKCINDRLGHEAGDFVLKEIAERINNHTRSTDTAARLGGDEFVVLLTNLDKPGDAETVALNIIVSIGKPFRFEVTHCALGASIGISYYPADGYDAETLMRKADSAMYHAKQKGKNNYQLFNSQTKTTSKITNYDIKELLAALIKFVISHKGQWSHGQWLDFMIELKRNGVVIERYFETHVRSMLDTLQKFYLAQCFKVNVEETMPAICEKAADFIIETRGVWTAQDWNIFVDSLESIGLGRSEELVGLLFDVVESIKSLHSAGR